MLCHDVSETHIERFLPPFRPDANATIKMEVGIEEWLHIEFEYDKAK